MEVSWGEEEELKFVCESPSPQPQPDLLIDLSPNTTDRMDEDSLTDSPKASAGAEVTKTKKKKSSTRTESISVKSSMSKLNMLEEKQSQASPAALGRTDSTEKKSEEQKKLCKACGLQVFAMECLRAEKAEWHKRCFSCSVCSKVLSVEAYSSHEGRLYCRPHFRELFQPKAVAADEAPDKGVDKTEVIIRESQPAPLPEGVIRASEPVDKGLEDLHLDLKSKFQLFENLRHQEKEPQESPPQPKRSGSVLAKLAKYQSKVGMDVGVPDEALAGGHGPTDENEASSDEDVDNTRKPHILDEINSEAIDSVRNKWAQGMTNRSDMITEHRREEQSKFRTRLLHGKNVQLKEMYERALVGGDATPESKSLSPDELVKSDTAKELKELFEKGDFKDVKSSESKLEGEVFESAIAKQSRQLFRDLDKGAVCQSPPSNPVPKPKRMDRTESLSSADVIRSSDVIDEIVKPVDLGSKFKFFEEGGHQRMDKKTFRITPPRDEQGETEQEEVEIYRDPSIVRSSDAAEPPIPVTRTASKMLSVFRQLEQQGSQESKVVRPLKEFTPPREPLRSAEDDEEESDDDSAESPSPTAFKEDHLKEVGGLARATSLRAKFEKWEEDENERNVAFEKESPSIESTKDLRAKFENLKREEEEKLRKRRDVKVNRFVELTNSGVAMENCVLCEKRVYVMEKTEAGGKIYHKSCFKCSVCKCVLRMDTFTSNKGTLYCTPHFKQLFKIKGNYDEGFGHDTQRIQWEKKKAKAEDKEN